VRPSVCQSLSNDTGNRFCHTFCIFNAKRAALVVPEIEFGKIAFQMLLADMVIGASDSAFHDRKVAFNRIGVNVAANVFANAVIDGFVFLKRAT